MLPQIQQYLNHYQSICPLITAQELDFIASALTVSEFNAKDVYLKVGDIQNSIAFVCKGLLRMYYVDENNNEINVWFAKENEYAADFISFMNQSPASYRIECLEPTITVNLGYQHMQEGYDKFKNIERYGRLITQEVYFMQQERMNSFVFKTAEQRYTDFVDNNNDLFNRISLTHLASYLGMERQSLSRVRKQISKK
jgi:CRP/FNR family transcriptional regulator, anaerobic regulatory protein